MRSSRWWQRLFPNQKFLHQFQWLILLFLIIFLLRLPSLFEPHRYADEEIYLTIGQALRRGLTLYRDIHDNKPPFIYWLAAISQDLVWLRLTLLFVHATGVIAFWRLSRLILPSSSAAKIATIVFALLSTLPLLEGNIANGENFMIVPALIGVYFFYSHLKNHRSTPSPTYFLVGVCFAAAFLFKTPVVFDFVALLLYWWFTHLPQKSLLEKITLLFSNQLWLMVAGFLLPIGLSIIYYTTQGAAEPYVRSALLQNLGYLSSWQGHAPLWQNHLVWKALLIGLAALGLSLAKISRPLLFLTLWSLFSLYGALLSRRPYPHYLLQPLAPITLLTIYFLSYRRPAAKSDRKVALATLALLTFLIFNNGFWHYSTLSYYQNFLSYLFGTKDKTAYYDYFQDSLRNYRIADYLRPRTDPTDRLFVWGTQPAIYALTHRLPVGRYTVAYHVTDFNGYQDTYQAILTNPPAYIVTFPTDTPDFPALNSLLATDYLLVHTIDGAHIYRYFRVNEK